MFSILGLDLTLIPWPILLLFIFLVFWIGWYLYIFHPIAEELDELKNDLPNIKLMVEKINNNATIINQIHSVLQKDMFSNELMFSSIDGKMIEILEKLITIDVKLNTIGK